MDAIPDPSSALLYGFIALLVVTLAVAIWAVSRVSSPGKPLAVLVVWMGVTGALAQSGVLDNWEARPPPLMGVLAVMVIGSIAVARSPFGLKLANGLSVGFLVGFQAFRFPLELLLHRAYSDGLMPVQMSYAGQNFDIVSGVLGLVLGLWAWRHGGKMDRRVAWGFNLIGAGLLFNIVGVAVASTPLFAAFGPDAVNRWVGTVPFIWLPVIFVCFAFIGHMLLTRRLLADARAE